jgi:hypothetical protein
MTVSRTEPFSFLFLWLRLIELKWLAMAIVVALPMSRAWGGELVKLGSPTTSSGYVCSLLINEVPFPGESGYMSATDTKAAMLAILWVLESRLDLIPPGYTQKEVAGVKTASVLGVIAGEGGKRQCEGFFKDAKGNYAMASRVQERINYLVSLANRRGKPGTFSELLNYASGLAAAYFHGGIEEADRFAGLAVVNRVKVTGRAYSWMTDKDCFHPGGNFVSIPDDSGGSLGGNRFFTLRKEKK